MVAPLVVTLDSNVYVSALHFGGRPRLLLEAARAGVFDLVVSDAIVAEVERTLRTKFGWEDGRLAEVRWAFDEAARRVTPTRRIAAVPDDPDDDRILECAVEAGAQYLVTGDRHLLRLEAFDSIRILTVAEILDRTGIAPAPAPPSAP